MQSCPVHTHSKPSWKDCPSSPSLCCSHPELHNSPASSASLTPDVSCQPAPSKVFSSLCLHTSHFLLSYQRLFPNFPNPAQNTSISFLNTHNVEFSVHQPLPPGRMFPFKIYISTQQISLSAEFIDSLKRKYVLVLLKSLLQTRVYSLFFETRPSPSR